MHEWSIQDDINKNDSRTCAPAFTCPTRYSTQTSAIRINKAFDSSGYLNSHVLDFWNVLVPPPSTIYAKSVHGAPQNPISGTSPFSSFLVIVIASNTYPSSSPTSTFSWSFLMSSGVSRGLGKYGPGVMRTSIPIACGMTRISQNMIAASTRPEKRRMGCMVISVARVGVRHISKNSWSSRTFRNSMWNGYARSSPSASKKNLPGRYLPAWRITHTGARSVSSPGSK